MEDTQIRDTCFKDLKAKYGLENLNTSDTDNFMMISTVRQVLFLILLCMHTTVVAAISSRKH